jgi:hypothetical protein
LLLEFEFDPYPLILEFVDGVRVRVRVRVRVTATARVKVRVKVKEFENPAY